MRLNATMELSCLPKSHTLCELVQRTQPAEDLICLSRIVAPVLDTYTYCTYFIRTFEALSQGEGSRTSSNSLIASERRAAVFLEFKGNRPGGGSFPPMKILSPHLTLY